MTEPQPETPTPPPAEFLRHYVHQVLAQYRQEDQADQWLADQIVKRAEDLYDGNPDRLEIPVGDLRSFEHMMRVRPPVSLHVLERPIWTAARPILQPCHAGAGYWVFYFQGKLSMVCRKCGSTSAPFELAPPGGRDAVQMRGEQGDGEETRPVGYLETAPDSGGGASALPSADGQRAGGQVRWVEGAPGLRWDINGLQITVVGQCVTIQPGGAHGER